MEVEFTFLTQRGTALMRRSQRASGERVRLGRGTDNEVTLADIRVGLRVAALGPSADGIAIEKLGAAPLSVNGQPVESAALHVGDQIRLGPYRIEVTQPPEGCDGAITIELVVPLAADPVTGAVRLGLGQTRLNKRFASWVGVLLLAVLFLAVPIFVFTSGALTPWHKGQSGLTAPTLVGLSWNTGEFSNSHRFFAANCATCHQGAFSRVADAACLTCHTTLGNHIEPGAKVGPVGERIAASRCIDCHSEHRGQPGVIFRSASLCLDCHRTLDKTAPEAGVAAVGGYPDGHPQFRATLVADAAKQQHVRVALDATPKPTDHPGIKFSHAAHLLPGGFPKLGYKQMACSDCHKAEPGGQGFLPITYKDQCQGCHNLKFDDVALPWADAKVPHGDDGAVIAAVWNFYAARTVKEGIGSAPAAAPAVERRGAGMPAPPEPGAAPGNALAWIADKTTTALGIVFDKNRGCAYCHFGTGANGAFDTDKIVAAMASAAPAPAPLKVIAPVELRTRFLPNAQFDHSRHRGLSCSDCHASGRAQTSAEVLIPGIETCETCHGAEKAHLEVKSTCITCHAFHRREFGPMHVTDAAKK